MLRQLFAASLICGLTKADDFSKMLLDALNAAKDTSINPAIHSAVPDPAPLNLGKDGSASTCILKLFGQCTCTAEADYSVSLQDVAGLKGFGIANFDSLDANIDFTNGFPLSIGISTLDVDVHVEHGHASAKACACGICPSASGTASTNVQIRASLKAQGKANIDLAKKCAHVVVDSVDVDFQNFKIHDTSVDIQVGPVPGVEVGNLVDLVNRLVPQIQAVIKGQLSDAVNKAVPGAINGKVQCIPVPLGNTTYSDVVV